MMFYIFLWQFYLLFLCIRSFYDPHLFHIGFLILGVFITKTIAIFSLYQNIFYLPHSTDLPHFAPLAQSHFPVLP